MIDPTFATWWTTNCPAIPYRRRAVLVALDRLPGPNELLPAVSYGITQEITT